MICSIEAKIERDHVISTLQATCRRLYAIMLAYQTDHYERFDKLMIWFQYSNIDVMTLAENNAFHLQPNELLPVLGALGKVSEINMLLDYQDRSFQVVQSKANRRRGKTVGAEAPSTFQFTWTGLVCQKAAQFGQVSVLQFAFDRLHRLDTLQIMHVSMKYGQLACLRYCYDLRQKICPRDIWAHINCDIAAANGHLDCLQFAVEHGCSASNAADHDAARAGRLSCLRYLASTRSLHYRVADVAAASGQLDCLQFMVSIQIYNSSIAIEAATHGHLHCLKYIVETVHILPHYLCVYAAKAGQLACMQYAHSRGCVWSNTCEKAAKGGHLECLRYAHQNGAKWKNTCTAAAKKDQLECLRYAHENGAPWNHVTYSSAHPNCRQYLKKKGCPRS